MLVVLFCICMDFTIEREFTLMTNSRVAELLYLYTFTLFVQGVHSDEVLNIVKNKVKPLVGY